MYCIYRHEDAVADLRAAWEPADDDGRQAIERASARIDERLVHDPARQGESREGQARVIFEPPVGALFEVDADQRLVSIVRSWVFGRPEGESWR